MTIKYHSQVGRITSSSTDFFVVPNPPKNIMVILTGLVELHNKVYDTELEYSDVFKPVGTYTQAEFDDDKAGIDQLRKDYPEFPDNVSEYGYEKQENVGRTIIEGADDNSIPSWMFGAIRGLMGYGVERFHLG